MPAQEREALRDYIDRESHYLLTLIERDTAPTIDLQHKRIVLGVRPGTNTERREELKTVLPLLLEKWEALTDVKASKVLVQRMKTKWGSCNPNSRAIRLNTDLAKKPSECLEYIRVHELAHFIEPSHNARFASVMNLFMPK